MVNLIPPVGVSLKLGPDVSQSYDFASELRVQ